MHWSGFGAEKSDRLAMKWLGRAVQQGCTKSQFFINKILAKAALLRCGRVEVKAVLDALVGAVAAVEERGAGEGAAHKHYSHAGTPEDVEAASLGQVIMKHCT